MSFAFAGSGPGFQAPDGCSVELYRRLPYLHELDGHRALFHPGTCVLELGCGAGRFTRVLLEWGASVTAVDNSPHMLSALPDGASRVLGDIETLQLADRFDVAVLASCLINHPEADVRTALLASAHRHLRPGGTLLLERHDPEWLCTVEPGPVSAFADIAVSVETAYRSGRTVAMTVLYEMHEQAWRHSFTVALLGEREIEDLLSNSGFASFAWSDKGKRWMRARRQDAAGSE